MEFILRLKEIEQKEKEIGVQETAAGHTQGVQQALLTAAGHTQGVQQALLEAQLSNSKQTLEIIKLTRVVTILTLVLVLLGGIQILLSMFHIAVTKGII